jgi:hypothetical protein
MRQRIKIQIRRVGLLSIAVCFLACAQTVKGQEPSVPQQQSAPPPAKFFAKVDRDRVAAAKDDKARLRTIIEIAETHLTDAETKTSGEEWEAASGSLGKYHALIESSLDFLSAMKPDQNKTRDLYKRLELALRAHGPRLTSIRRMTPLEYAVWIKEIEDFARKGRTQALNSFYGTTVLKDQQSQDNEKRSKNQNDARSPNNQ